MKLADLKNGEEGIITKVRGRGAFRKRIIEMGFVKGKLINVIKNAPLKDPIEYKIMDYNITLRRSEATMIDVLTPEETAGINNLKGRRPFRRARNRRGFSGQFKTPHHKLLMKGFHKHAARRYQNIIPEIDSDDDLNNTNINRKLKKSAAAKGEVINIALVGNPNSGKTTLFNRASGSRERVANYGGVTVDAKISKFKQDGYTFNIVDLPGTYSLTAYTPEELFVRNHIFNQTPDVVVNIIDSSNLERNLYLATQLIDMDIKIVVALNMHDELEKKGDEFDYITLGEMIGIPFIPTVASKGIGLKELFRKVIEVYEDRDKTIRHIHINYGKDIEKSIKKIQEKIYSEDTCALTDAISSRFLAIKLLEKDRAAEEKIFQNCKNNMEILNIAKNERNRLENDLKEDSETLFTDAKYSFIAGALMETFRQAERPKRTMSEKIDTILTHKILGFPIFLFFLWLMFQLTFKLGEYPMNWIDSSISFLSNFISLTMPDGPLKNLITDGAIAGVGGVIIFLPNILILFFLISLMEDTGYMARASFIMDKLMHKIGLHGKSFIPMIMGFGCNVPAIMATRILESKNDRLLTMLIIPLMSCSARLPVYVLFISTFFPESPGSMLSLIYLIGALIAIISAVVLKKTIFRTYDIPFVMELPSYKIPYMKNTLKHMWEKGIEYLKKIGGIVLVASILIWALGEFPKDIKYSKDYDGQIVAIEEQYKQEIKSEPINNAQLIIKKKEKIKTIKFNKNSERLEKSFIGQIGHLVEPLIRPLGFDWKMGVSIVTGLAAKEIVVSTMGVLYHADKDADETSKSLIYNLKNQVYTFGPHKGEKVFTSLTAFCFIIFVLIYFPCIAVMATIRKESGSWKWAVFAAAYTTFLAWVITFLIYRIGGFLLY